MVHRKLQSSTSLSTTHSTSLKSQLQSCILLAWTLSIDNGVPHSGMLLYLHHRDFKIFFHPAKFDNFKDEKISDFKTVSVSQSKNLLD